MTGRKSVRAVGSVLGLRGRWILQLTIHRLRTDKPFATKGPNEAFPDTATDNRTNCENAMEVSLLTPWLKAFDSVALSRVEWGIKRGVKVGTKYHIGVSHKV